MATTEPPKPATRHKRKRRTAGRPEQPHAVGGESIVDAALELLKTSSPDKLTVVQVAARANVDPALVRYYFGDKKGLLHAAALRLLDEVQDQGQAALEREGTFEQRVRRRLEILMRALGEHPRYMQLVIGEIYGATEAEAPGSTADLRLVAERGLRLTRALLEQASDAPKLREVDVRHLHVAILGLCTFFRDARPLLDVLFASKRSEARLTASYIDFATMLLTRGLLAQPGQG